MQKNYRFKIGQRVHVFDIDFVDDGDYPKGEVVDTSRDSVFILFDGWSDSPQEYFYNEFDIIKVLNENN